MRKKKEKNEVMKNGRNEEMKKFHFKMQLSDTSGSIIANLFFVILQPVGMRNSLLISDWGIERNPNRGWR